MINRLSPCSHRKSLRCCKACCAWRVNMGKYGKLRATDGKNIGNVWENDRKRWEYPRNGCVHGKTMNIGFSSYG